jgi:hypothetical protein
MWSFHKRLSLVTSLWCKSGDKATPGHPPSYPGGRNEISLGRWTVSDAGGHTRGCCIARPPDVPRG